MSCRPVHRLRACLCAALILLPALATAQAHAGTDSTFTYQGRLADDGTALDGFVDLRFTLFDAATEGSQVGPQIQLLNLTVADGVFSADLDFGSDSFDGGSRWLEIAVRTPPGSGSFETLEPRQPIRPAPYSIRALTGGGSGDTRVFDLVDGNAVFTTGFLGIGTTAPATPIHVRNGVAGLVPFSETVLTVESASNAWLSILTPFDKGRGIVFADTSNAFASAIVYNASSAPQGLQFRANGNQTFMTIASSGNVGVGTTAPTAKLDVRNGVMALTDAAGFQRASLSLGFGGTGVVATQGANGSTNTALTFLGTNPSNGLVGVYDQNSVLRAGIFVNAIGFGEIFGDVKNLRVPNPRDPETELWYACVEGPEAAVYVRGTTTLTEGRAVIELPEHFRSLATEHGMTVQLTPLAAESRGLAVVRKSLEEGVEVRELMQGRGSYAFDWQITAVRRGHEDFEVVRPKGLLTSTAAPN